MVPDPVYHPGEYFVLEYRKSTGSELWRPDGGLEEEELMITHVNERMGVRNDPWLKREAPYFDPEFADFSDRGAAMWTGRDRLNGVLFHGSRDSFTPTTQPSSDFDGGRTSGLSVTMIHVEHGICYFAHEIDASR